MTRQQWRGPTTTNALTHILREGRSPPEAITWTTWCGLSLAIDPEDPEDPEETTATPRTNFHAERWARKASCGVCRRARTTRRTRILGWMTGLTILLVGTLLGWLLLRRPGAFGGVWLTLWVGGTLVDVGIRAGKSATRAHGEANPGRSPIPHAIARRAQAREHLTHRARSAEKKED